MWRLQITMCDSVKSHSMCQMLRTCISTWQQWFSWTVAQICISKLTIIVSVTYAKFKHFQPRKCIENVWEISVILSRPQCVNGIDSDTRMCCFCCSINVWITRRLFFFQNNRAVFIFFASLNGPCLRTGIADKKVGFSESWFMRSFILETTAVAHKHQFHPKIMGTQENPYSKFPYWNSLHGILSSSRPGDTYRRR